MAITYQTIPIAFGQPTTFVAPPSANDGTPTSYSLRFTAAGDFTLSLLSDAVLVEHVQGKGRRYFTSPACLSPTPVSAM